MRRPLAMSLVLFAFAACSGDDGSTAAPSTSATDTAVAPNTTAAAGSGSATWTYPNLDGQDVTVDESNDSASTAFVGDIPMPVSIIDAASDCAALQSEVDFWMSTAR